MMRLAAVMFFALTVMKHSLYRHIRKYNSRKKFKNNFYLITIDKTPFYVDTKVPNNGTSVHKVKI